MWTLIVIGILLSVLIVSSGELIKGIIFGILVTVLIIAGEYYKKRSKL